MTESKATTHAIYLGEAIMSAEYVANALRANYPTFTFDIKSRHIQVFGDKLPIIDLERAAEKLIDAFYEQLTIEDGPEPEDFR